MLFRFLSLICFNFFISFSVLAEQCSAVFPDGAQSNNNGGKITFYSNGNIANNPDTELSARNIDDFSSGNSCTSVDCSISGSVSPTVSYNTFPNNSNSSFQYNNAGSFNHSPSDGAQITVNNNNAIVTLAPGDYKSLIINGSSNTTVNLSAGDYTFSNVLTLNQNSKLQINGTDIVRIFVKNAISLNNGQVNVGGSATQLLLFSNKNINLYSGTINGFLYSKEKIEMQVPVTGALSGKNVTINNQTLTFESTVPDFGDFCESGNSPPAVILDLRFDEIGWSGANSVIDSSGNNFHGTPTNSSPTQGFICNAANLTPIGNSDFISINANAMDTLDDFTISVWGKSKNPNGQTVLSAANSSVFHELVMLFDNNDNFIPFLNDTQSTALPISAINDEIWHHLVWTRADTNNCLYIDGALQGCAVHAAGALDVDNLILGQKQNSNGGGFQAGEAWQGLLDELLIFNGAIDASEVTSIYNNQLAALNWDGSARESSCTAAWWALEENFLDSSPTNPHHLLDVGDPVFGIDNPGPANTIGVESTCNYVSFDGSNYAEIDDSGDFNFQDLTVSAWVNPSSYGSSLRSLVSKDEHFEFHLNSSGRLYWWWRSPGGTQHTLTSSAVIPIDTWTHVAVVYDSAGFQTMYVNGVVDQSASFNDGLANTPCDFYIGTDVHTNTSTVCGAAIPARNFIGHMDEVRIYDRVLSLAEIEADRQVVHACGSIGMDHYQIEHDGAGITCEAEPITILACADANCDNLHTDPIILNIEATNSDPTTITSTMPAFTGRGEVSFNHTTKETVTLSIGATDQVADNALVCVNGGSSSCDIIFTDTQFRFLSNETTTIPTQLSGKPSNTGFNNSILELQAIRTNTTTGACEAALLNEGEIELSATCVDPNECAGQQVTINNNLIETIDNADPPSYSPVTLNFSGTTKTGAAEFIFSYPDAGQIQLNARYNLPATNGDPSGDYMVGSSNSFVVRPFGFYLNATKNDATANPAATTASGDVFVNAGEEFTVNLTAMNWASGQDNVGIADGIPDDNDDLSGNAITPNFGNETSAQLVDITAGFVLPAAVDGGVLGDLTNAIDIDFANGSQTITNMTYSEVGIISLMANVKNGEYLTATGGNIIGNISYVGRFIPDHFVQTIESGDEGSLDVNHGASLTCSSVDWAYSGQTTGGIGAIQYQELDAPELTIAAYNGLTPATITQNYRGDFAKILDAETTPDLTDGVFFDNTSTTHINGLEVTGNTTEVGDYIDNENGSVTYTLASEHHFTYTKDNASKIAPFEAQFELPITNIQDSDDVKLKPTDTIPYFMNPTFNEALPNNTVNIRFGRWYIENAYGPETEDLIMPMAIQQWNGTAFETNADESCITPNYGSRVTAGDIYSGSLNLWDYRVTDISTATDEPIAPADASVTAPDPLVAFDAGEYRDFIFNVPNARGSLEMEYEIPSWLKYDWQNLDGNNNGPYTDNPTATATFGLFRGNDRIISWREIGN